MTSETLASSEIMETEEENGIKKKQSKSGIIYLSTVPPKMNVTQIRDYFSQFGEIDRSFLQPEKGQKKGKKNQVFTEGWIEFKKRRHAKRVAAMLNNNPIGGKKKKQNYDFLWNIKYLPGLQWVHINERLAYERISHQQKQRAEIAAAKREASFFASSVSLNKRLKKGNFAKSFNNDADRESGRNEEESNSKNLETNHNSDDDVVISNTPKNKEFSASRLKLFQNLFQTE